MTADLLTKERHATGRQPSMKEVSRKTTNTALAASILLLAMMEYVIPWKNRISLSARKIVFLKVYIRDEKKNLMKSNLRQS